LTETKRESMFSDSIHLSHTADFGTTKDLGTYIQPEVIAYLPAHVFGNS